MKTIRLPLVGLLTCFLAIGEGAESAQQLLTEAQAAYVRGDIATAKKLFTEIIRLDPRNTTAIGYLRMIAADDKKKPAGNSIQKQLETLMLPKVEFKEATFGSVLDFLKQTAVKNSGGKVAMNFVVQIPDEQLKTKTVTLSLTNVPMSEVLRYLGGLADVDFSYEKYAIVVKPHVAPVAAPAPGS